MKASHITGLFVSTGLALFSALFACSPKHLIKGQVVDADTHRPIKGAAIAVRWLADTSEQSAHNDTFDAVQALSDDKGIFQIPQYPEKKYILGVYKNGYICWNSREIFHVDPESTSAEKYPKRKALQLIDHMKIELQPFKKDHPRDLHAGFTVMTAGETTVTHDGPFHRAIEAEYRLWQDTLRRVFNKNLGQK